MEKINQFAWSKWLLIAFVIGLASCSSGDDSAIDDAGDDGDDGGTPGVAIIRLSEIDATTDVVTITNLGDADADISSYWLCLGPGRYNQLSDYTQITGDLNLSANEDVVIDVTSGSGNVTDLPDDSAGLGLFVDNSDFSSTDPTLYIDFVQYGAGGQSRAAQAVTAGIWDSDNSFVSGLFPYLFTGDGDDVGSTFWDNSGTPAPAPAPVIIRITELNTTDETVVITNFGDDEIDISGYWLCLGPGMYNQLSNYSTITGDLNLSTDEQVTIALTSGSQNVTALPDESAGLGLFVDDSNFGSTDPAIYVDFVQYGSGAQSRATQAVSAGIWDDDALFVGDESPYSFSGTGNDIGSTFWDGTAPVMVVSIRIAEVNPVAELVTITNLGNVDVDISGYWLCLGPNRYNQLSDYTTINGDLNLSPAESTVITVTSGSQNVTALPDDGAGLGLFSTNTFGSTDSSIYVDYVQWEAGGQDRSGQAVTAGIWDDDALFVSGMVPYTFTGGVSDVGSDFWVNSSTADSQ